MILRIKTFAVFVAVMLIIFSSQIATRIFIELPSYRNLENINDRKDIESIIATINTLYENLENYCLDYANWDDSSYFIKNRNESYIKSNFPENQLPGMGINGVVYFDNSKNIIFSKAQDSKTGKKIKNHFTDDKNKEIINRIFIPPETVAIEGSLTNNTGIIIINNKPVIFSIARISDSDSNAPSSGNLLFWKFFDLDTIYNIIDNTQLNIQFFWNNNPDKKENNIVKSHDYPVKGKKYYRNKENKIIFSINDFFNNPVLDIVIHKIEHDFDNSIFSKNLIAGIISSLLCILFLLYYTNKHFLGTLNKFLNHFEQVKKKEDYTIKLSLNRKDELSTLADSINKMFEQIEYKNSLLKISNVELENLSNTDSLTQISNRRYLDIYLKEKWKEAIQNKTPISFCLCDVDFFKLYNDNYGHVSGDMVLKEIAYTLKNNLHPATDLAARYGGEEFAIVLTNTDTENSCSVAKNILKSIENLNIRHSKSICSPFITISMGISTITPEPDTDLDLLIKYSDKELYKAKESGRNRYCHD